MDIFSKEYEKELNKKLDELDLQFKSIIYNLNKKDEE